MTNVQKNPPFFPNKAPHIMRALSALIPIANSLSPAMQMELYELVSTLVPELMETQYREAKEFVLVTQNQTTLTFPNPVPVVKFAHHLCGYEEWLSRKYALPGFVEVEPNDLVIDCGAYVGGFSLSAVKLGAIVHAFEPDEINFACCKANLSQFPNARVIRKGLYNQSGTAEFHISGSSVEHSMLEPDDGTTLRLENIEVIRLSDYMDQNGLDRIDFLKLEAEGVEPEIYEGLEGRHVSKIAIDISPERNGESPLPFFEARLKNDGFEIQQRANVLFARRKKTKWKLF